MHDMGDPVAAARHAAEVLAPGGTVLLIEPFPNDRVEENISPVAPLLRRFDDALLCACGLGRGTSRARGAGGGGAPGGVFRKAGFTHFRRAAETPFNLILEVRR